MKLTLPANQFAAAWLNVTNATADDGTLAAICIEAVDHNQVRLVATDSYWMLRSWVDNDPDLTDDPGIDITGDTILAVDTEGRMANLMKWVHKVSRPRGDDPPLISDLELTITSGELDDRPTLDSTLDRQVLVVDTDHEKVRIPISEHTYPDWRSLTDQTAEGLDMCALSLQRLGRIGTVRNAVGHAELTFNGPRRPVGVHVPGNPNLDGLIMPVHVERTDSGSILRTGTGHHTGE